MTSNRMTNQRRKILDYLKSVHNHPNAEEIYTKVKKDLPQITLATVYRNLNLMAEQGLILRLEIDKEYHYDACTGCHQHCVCEVCGKIMDSFQEDINNYALKKLNLKGFNAETAMIIFRGKCDKCSKVKK